MALLPGPATPKDEDDGQFRRHLLARDSSGHGNDLPLEHAPERYDGVIKASKKSSQQGELTTGMCKCMP